MDFDRPVETQDIADDVAVFVSDVRRQLPHATRDQVVRYTNLKARELYWVHLAQNSDLERAANFAAGVAHCAYDRGA